MQQLLAMREEVAAILEIAVRAVVPHPGASIGTMVLILVAETVKNLLPDLALARAAAAGAPAIGGATHGECPLYNGPIMNATAEPVAAAGAKPRMVRAILPPLAAPQQVATARRSSPGSELPIRCNFTFRDIRPATDTIDCQVVI